MTEIDFTTVQIDKALGAETRSPGRFQTRPITVSAWHVGGAYSSGLTMLGAYKPDVLLLGTTVPREEIPATGKIDLTGLRIISPRPGGIPDHTPDRSGQRGCDRLLALRRRIEEAGIPLLEDDDLRQEILDRKGLSPEP